MKRTFFIMMLAAVALTAFSQEESAVDSKTARKLEREQRKIQQKLQAEATARMVDSLIAQRSFIIQAEYIGNQTGQRVVVDEKINYIIVDSADIVIQYGSLGVIGGYNGLGGITTDGNITQYLVTRRGKDKDTYSLKIYAMTTTGMYDVFFTIFSDGSATATIGGNNSGNKLVYYGNVLPIQAARIFKGSVI